METRRLVIECAENGFLVYVNEDFSQGIIRPIPYVFESMESLQKFIDERLAKTEKTTIRQSFT
jgi:hypothetical protein